MHMPLLETLELVGIAPEITNRLLAFIHAPVCKVGILEGYVRGDPLETLFSSDVSHFFDHMRSGANAGSITCSSDGIRIVWTGPWYMTLLVEDIKFAKGTLNWLSSSPAPNPPVVPLRMTIYERDPALVEEILEVTTDMEALHRVTFGYETPVAGALRFLATGSLVGGQPFPALDEICIDESIKDDDWEYVSEMLRRRKGDMEVRDGLKQLKPVRRLRLGGTNLYLGDDEEVFAEFGLIHWPNHLEEVRRLLGPEGELVWYGRIVTQEGVLGDHARLDRDD
ncbi:hypothetical protein M407DRAFT_242398 [Tulasnella calospora MUT 4182]|uniref:Uncharacterized protein n=1 Tax=Tulasnella calospora MUT 4182 TaxID=1051891 RepID=A0A0C3QFB5_9AGAM|nr:hypothetical protein M407DRAFT_242398 [Tulasnella calospora MUT 4182]